MRTAKAACSVLLLALSAMACSTGGSDESTPEEPSPQETSTDGPSVAAGPYVEALAEQLATDGSGASSFDAEQSSCVAEKWVTVMDPERLEAAGVEPDDLRSDIVDDVAALELTEDDAATMARSFGDCDIDLVAAYLDQAREQTSISTEQEGCVRASLTQDLFEQRVAAIVLYGRAALDDDDGLSEEVDEAEADAEECFR